jgi:hypothetical protein
VVRVPALPDPVAAPRPAAVPTRSPEGRRYVSGNSADTARQRLAALCGAVRRAAAGGRHRCLLWAAARGVELDDALPRAEIAAALLDAARSAGLQDSDRELERHVRNGFKLGLFGTGAHA